MALHFTADQKGKISFSLSHSLVYQPEKVTEGKDELIFNGIIQGNGLGYTIRMKVLHQGGSIKVGHQQITVEGADEATVFYTVDTEYSPYIRFIKEKSLVKQPRKQ